MLRRGFLQGVLLLGCTRGAPIRVDEEGGLSACAGAFDSGTSLGIVPFVDEDDVAFGTMLGSGLDGRLFTDLSRLQPGKLLIDNDAFYVRTSYPDLLDASKPWIVTLGGRVRAAVTIGIDEIVRDERPMGATLLECSGNASGGHFGLMSAAEWSGVPVTALLDRVERSPDAARVLVSGFDEHSKPSSRSTPGASWIFSMEELRATGAFLATRMNGAPLPRDHGAPLRLVVPGWYGCTCIKWVDTISFVSDDEPSTPHMREFASRTHQSGVPALARDYAPASMDLAAMPIRVERWSVRGETRYRVVGIQWGGAGPTDRLRIRFSITEPWEDVALCAPPPATRIWSLWEHAWSPPAPGRYTIELSVADPAIRTRRLDAGYYRRAIVV